MSYMMYPEMLDDYNFRKIVALGVRVINVKPFFRKARNQELTILFTINNHEEDIRSYDTDYPWQIRHVLKDQEVKKELDNWVETGILPVWAVKI